MVGEQVGSYRVTHDLARTRWGERFAAADAAGAPVELLLVDADASADRARADRCLADARAAAALGQPAIAPLLAAGLHADGRVYLATPQLPGDTLAARIAAAGRLSAPQIAIIGRQIATALAAAHARGFGHRDLAPADILIVPAPELPHGERVLVYGFGLAQLGGHRAPAYVAPEQWDDAAAPDLRSDIYALGCLAFEMACGQPPFGTGALAELRARHLSAPPPSARSLQPDVPGGLEHLLGKLLQKRPEDRPPSVADLVRTFEVLGGGALATAPLAPTGMGEALPPVLARPAAPVGFAPAIAAQARSAQMAQSFSRPALPPSAIASAPSVEPSSAVLHGSSDRPLTPRAADAPRYSEPPRKRGLAAWQLVLIALLVAAAAVVAFTLTR